MASKDQSIGASILLLCIVGIVVYGWLVFLTEWNILVLQLTGFIAVGGILLIGAWIGWTMATTPPPKPIEELEEEIKAESAEEKETEEKPKATKKNTRTKKEK